MLFIYFKTHVNISVSIEYSVTLKHYDEVIIDIKYYFLLFLEQYNVVLSNASGSDIEF